MGPCKDCEDRTLYCHDTCEKYKKYKIKQNRINAKRNEMKREEYHEYRFYHKRRNSL